MARCRSDSISFSVSVCFALPFLHECREAGAVFIERVAVGGQPVAFFGDILAQADEFTEVAGELGGARAHVRDDSAEQHRRAQRLQRVFRLTNHAGRGRRRPARCSAASTSAISSRR
jgi:hypothetical protein